MEHFKGDNIFKQWESNNWVNSSGQGIWRLVSTKATKSIYEAKREYNSQ